MRGDRGGARRVPSPDKQAVIWAAKNNLKPWEVPPPTPPSRKKKPRSIVMINKPAPPRAVTPRQQTRFENTQYRAALAAPVNVKIKVPGRKGKLPARQVLAQSMTNRERREYHQRLVPPPPRRDTSLLHALIETPKSIYGHYAAVAVPVAKKLFGGPYLGQGPLGGTVPTRREFHEANKALVGPALYNAITRGQRSHLGAAAIEAALFLPPGKALRMTHGLVEAVGHAPLGRKAALAAYEARTGTPLFGAAVVSQARRATALRGIPERADLHAQVDAMIGNKKLAKEFKGQLDAEAYQHARRAAPAERKAAATQAYRDVLETTQASQGIRVKRNARLEAELNPHHAPLPRGGVNPLDEAATVTHIDQSIADAARMKSVEKNPASLMRTFQNAHRLAEAGVRFRKWYRTSAAGILQHVHGDKEEADRLAQLFGIYSANRDVPANSVLALRAYDEAMAGREITQGSAPQIKAATKVMSGTPWEGRKTNSFYSNMLKHIDREKYRREFGNREVTVDIWMMRMFGFKGKSPTDAQYTWIENHIRELARQLGWTPEEVQAAAWVALKSEAEKTSLETAAFDFAHGIATHRGQVNFKVLPDALRGRLSPGQQEQHLRDVLDVVAPGGRNLIHEIAGVPGIGGHAGLGGVAQYIPLLRTKGLGGDYIISKAERQLAEEASAAHGIVFDQPEVAYGRVFQPKTIGHANAVTLRLPGGLSDELATKLAQTLPKGSKVIHAREGAWLVNETKTENKAWIKQVEDAFRSIDATLFQHADAAAFDGAVIRRNQYDDLFARLQQRRPGAGEAVHGLASDVERVNQRYLDLAGGERRVAGTTEHSGPGAAERFSSAVSASKAGEYGAFLSTPDDTVLSTWRFFLGGPNDGVHYALSPDGDFGYFSSRIPGAGRPALEQAIQNGARTLDAFDGFLPAYYEKAGFREVARNPWNDEFAPPNWDYEKYGRPDVVHMAYRPDLPIKKSGRRLHSWDRGKEIAASRAQRPLGGEGNELLAFRTGFEGPPTPEEEAWRRAHPYREPSEAEVPLGSRYEPPVQGAATAGRQAKTPAAQFNKVAVKTSTLRARQVELLQKLDKTPFEWEELGRIKVALRTKRAIPSALPRVARTRPVEEIVEGMRDWRGAESLLGKQNVIQREERARRAGAAAEARAAAGGGLAGQQAALAELRGELPKLRYKSPVSEDEVDKLIRWVEDNRIFGEQEYKNIRIAEAFKRVARGQLPQQNQIKLLKEVFGDEKVAELQAEIDWQQQVLHWAREVAALPRTMRSSVDFSAPFRQGLFMMYAEPELWAKAWGPGVKAMNAKNYEAFMVDLLSRPTAKFYQPSGLAIVGKDGLGSLEEAFTMNLSEKIPLVGHSQRGYEMFLNRLRADTFDEIYRQGILDHPEWLDNAADHEKFIKSIGTTVNMLTGRGRLPFGWEPAVNAFSVALFSPRLIASRVEYLLRVGDPRVWAPGARVGRFGFDPRQELARRMIRRSLSRQVGIAGGLLVMASFIPGVEVGIDPRSADFGKIKVGDFRVDILGGAQQYLVLGSRLVSGEKTNSSTGETKKLEGYGHTRVIDTMIDFLDNKAAPVPAFFLAWDAGRTPIGDEFNFGKQLGLTFTPLGLESAVETGRQYGAPVGALDYLLSSVGFGTGVYGSKPTSKPGANMPPPSGVPGGGSWSGGGGGSSWSGGGGGSSWSGG